MLFISSGSSFSLLALVEATGPIRADSVFGRVVTGSARLALPKRLTGSAEGAAVAAGNRTADTATAAGDASRASIGSPGLRIAVSGSVTVSAVAAVESAPPNRRAVAGASAVGGGSADTTDSGVAAGSAENHINAAPTVTKPAIPRTSHTAYEDVRGDVDGDVKLRSRSRASIKIGAEVFSAPTLSSTLNKAGRSLFGRFLSNVRVLRYRLLRPDRGLTHSKHCFRSVNVRVQEEFAAVIGIWVLLFFFVACVVAWLVLFEEARDRAGAALSALLARVRGSRNATFGWLSQRSRHASTHARGLGGDIFAGFGLRPAISIAALLILMLPVVTILLLRRDVALEGFDANQRQRSSVLIEELLRGERLIPPPAPPMEVFLAPEVEAAVPMVATADRKWSQLDPEFTQRMLAVFQVMKVEYGYEMVLIEGYRSPQRQNQLAAKGSHVTLATAGRSWHQYGLAADCAFLRNGKIVISERDPWAMRGYQLYGQVAKQAGMVWGGDWKSIKDLMHVELRRPGVMRR